MITAKMNLTQFITIYESLKKHDRRRTIEQAYDLAEAVHQGLYSCRRYPDLSVFLTVIKRRNQKRRNAAREKEQKKGNIVTVSGPAA